MTQVSLPVSSFLRIARQIELERRTLRFELDRCFPQGELRRGSLQVCAGTGSNGNHTDDIGSRHQEFVFRKQELPILHVGPFAGARCPGVGFRFKGHGR